MQQLRKFHPYILPDVPGAPINVVNNALISVIIDFCEKSLLWKKESEPTTVRAGYGEYSFAPDPGSKVVEPVYAELDKEALAPVSLDELDTYHPGWRTLEEKKPKMFLMVTDETIRLIGKPTEDYPEGLKVTVALKPERDATEVPDFIYEDWAETIASGVLSKLHGMSMKPWAEPQLVTFHYRKYRNGLTRAKSKAHKSRQGQVKTTIKPRKFGELFNV